MFTNVNSINKLLDLVANPSSDENEANIKSKTEVWKNFNVEFSRYIIDSNLSEGWEMYDTPNDNADFGIWVNLNTYQILNLSQGIVILESFKDETMFKDELKHMYVPQPITCTVYKLSKNGVCKRSVYYTHPFITEGKKLNFISITWTIEDVINVREDLSKEQAREVLQEFDHSYDCSRDFSVLEIIANDLYPK